MGITTIVPPLEMDRVRDDVLDCLRRQPETPLSPDFILGCIAGVTSAQVETALRELEGPAPASMGSECAYVHRCGWSGEAVYTP